MGFPVHYTISISGVDWNARPSKGSNRSRAYKHRQANSPLGVTFAWNVGAHDADATDHRASYHFTAFVLVRCSQPGSGRPAGASSTRTDPTFRRFLQWRSQINRRSKIPSPPRAKSPKEDVPVLPPRTSEKQLRLKAPFFRRMPPRGRKPLHEIQSLNADSRNPNLPRIARRLRIP